MARILIAEDNSLVRWTMAALLRSHGHDVDLAVDGQQALYHFFARPADMVVLDVHMPGMDGLEACQRLRQRSAVPILMISTLDYAPVRDQALKCGANAFLPKPLEPDHLLGWVRALCAVDPAPPHSSEQPTEVAARRAGASVPDAKPDVPRRPPAHSIQATALHLSARAGIRAIGSAG